MQALQLTDKVALVTGATRGIGAAIAQQLQQQGAQVFGTATSAAGADRISEALGREGAGLVLNVADSDQCAETVKHIQDTVGPIAVLVNNAGITQDQILMRMRDEDFDRVLDVNLKSVFRMSKAVLRGMMKARWGRIINIASVVGVMGNAGQSNYAASKAGMLGFSKSLAREIGSRGITVNVVAPGYIATDMTDSLSDDQRDSLMSQVPLTRLGEPADIAHAVGYLASDMASYVTGETIHVNGGMLMV